MQGRPAGWRLKEELQSKFKGSLLAEFLLVRGRSVFVLLRPLTNSARPTHMMEGNQSTDMNFIYERNTLTETSGIMLGQLSEHHVLAERL